MKNSQVKLKRGIKSLKVIFFLIQGLLITGCAKVEEREPEIYLLPEGFKGSVYIIFNIPKGKPPKYEVGARIYEIPSSGVLMTQMKANQGWIHSDKIKYIFINKDGSKTPITGRWTSSLHDTPDNRKDKKITIFGGGLGEFQPVKGCYVLQQEFMVGTKSEVLDDKLYFGIYSSKGIKNIDKSIFEGACLDY